MEEANQHILQHFKQRICECGAICIKIGNIWYGPHNCFEFNAEVSSELQEPEEVLLPDFIEVKAEEILDVEEEVEEEIEEDDVFCKDSEDDEEIIAIDDSDYVDDMSSEYEIQQNTKQNTQQNTQQNSHCNRTATGQWNLVSFVNKKQPHKQPSERATNRSKRTEQSSYVATSDAVHLTAEQISSRKCPICSKIIKNRQNLICHMNIHKGISHYFGINSM